MLKRLWHWLASPSPTKNEPLAAAELGAVELPAEVRAAVMAHDLASVQHWLQRECEKRQDAAALDPLLPVLSEAGWPTSEREKLFIFAQMCAGKHPAAIERARDFKRQWGEDADVTLIEAFCLFQCNAFDEAWQRVKALHERSPEVENRLDFLNVAILVGRSTTDSARLLYFLNRARQLAPDHPIIALNGYGIYFELGEMAAFEQIEREIAEGRYDLTEAALALAHVALAQGDYETGWRVHEGRYRMKEAGRYLNPALLSFPRWQGELLSGKRLLISCEQGLGDTVMMARYFPRLVDSGAEEIFIEAQAEAIPLLIYNFPDLIFLPRRHGQLPDCRFDCWCGSMSLPYIYRTRVDDVPAREEKYLKVPPDTAAYWQGRVKALRQRERPSIGLTWSGSRTHRTDRLRSLPAKEIFAVIANWDADFFALQKEIPADLPENLHDVSEELLSLADTAALIEQMDLVISVDTSAVHLAGALGKATWLLLPFRYEWRWGLTGEENPWYASIKVIRQKSPGDWPGVLQTLAKEYWPAWRAQWQASAELA
ncbi:MAG: hypothetical protein N3C63_01465 [Rhodocyclaceae bacterium]|nr:hypothetical protein [Rhodocyclaceae bacterium]